MSQREREVFQAFFDAYRNDWPGFVRDVWKVEPDGWQAEVLAAASGSGTRLLTIRSGKGAGKSALLSWVAILHLLFRYPFKGMATSPSKPQLQAVLVPEMRSWIGKLPPVLQALFEVKAETIELRADPPNAFLTFRTARDDSPESLQGLHAPWVLVVVDEASDASAATMDSILGVLADPNPCILLAGNPLRNSGYFFDSHMTYPHWRSWRVSILDSPRHNPTFPASVLAEFGERSNAWRVQILGEFPTAEDDSLIPYELVEAAKTRDVGASGGPVVWGVDVARFGDDASALAKRQGNVQLEPVQLRYKLDLMQVCGWVKAEYDGTPVAERPVLICVDVIGLGAGVVDRLRELGLPVRGVNVAEAPAMKGQWRNLRGELWAAARDWFARRECRLAADDTLAKQLVQPRFSYASNGVKVLEAKAETKQRLRHSPDAADAFILTFAADAVVALHGGTNPLTDRPLRRGLVGLV